MKIHLTGWIGIVFTVILSNSSVHAEVFYVTQIKHAQWNDKDLSETVEKLKEHKPIKLAEPLKLEPFHHRTVPAPEQQGDFCISCHTSLPHTQSERLRSYLNMHVNYLACTVCHYRPEGVVLKYRWHELIQAIEPETTRKIITPFHQQRAMSLTKTYPDIAGLLESWEESDIRRKAEVHLRIHIPLKPEGTVCKSCHTTGTSLLDYRQLGYEEDAIKAIVENRIARYLSDESFKEKPIILMDLLR